jgi:hypothetical protein
MDFQQERFGRGAAAYDERIRKLFPFYDTIHPAINAILRGLLGRESELLIVAAGTGAEILELGKANAGWRFLGVDRKKGISPIIAVLAPPVIGLRHASHRPCCASGYDLPRTQSGQCTGADF